MATRGDEAIGRTGPSSAGTAAGQAGPADTAAGGATASTPATPRVPECRTNPLVAAIAPPPVPAIKALAARYDGSAGPLLDLSQAVPDRPPHPALLAALAAAAADPEAAGYGAIAGEPRFRDAYARDVRALYGGDVAPDNVMATAGCNQAFFVAALATAAPGEAILTTEPCYFNHDATLRMLGIEARPVPLRQADGFVPHPEAVAAAVGPGVRALALVSPNNPTGAVYGPGRLTALYETCRRAGIRLILDETYRDFLPPGSGRPHGLFEREDWRDGLVALYSFSKAYAIPGHRLGALVAGEAFLAEAEKVMDNLQICAPRPAQAAVSALIGPLADFRRDNAAAIARRAAAFRGAFAGAGGWQIASMGAYFAYVRHPFDGLDATRLAERLALEAGVLALPGPFFGARQERFLRMAFANVDEAAVAGLPARLAAVRAP